MKKTKKLAALFSAVLILVLSCAVPTGAKLYDETKINSKYAAVYNIENGKFIFEKGADKQISVAGSAKIMTALIALDYYKDLDKKITVTYEALEGLEGATVLGLLRGEVVTARDLIYTMLVGGCNDSANIIAYDIAGNIAGFSKMMNEKAESIGLTDTVYKNPTGLENVASYTNVKDVALLCAYARSNNRLREIVNMTKYTVPATEKHEERTVYTKNFFLSKQTQLIYYWQNAEGISSSFTDKDGYMLISSLSEYSLTYICVVSGSNRAQDGTIYAYGDVRSLLEWAVEEYTTMKILDETKIFGEVKVALSKDTEHISIVPEKNIYAFLPHDTVVAEEISYRFEITESELEAPVEKGESVGTIKIYKGEELLAECALVTKTSASRSGALSFAKEFFSSTSLAVMMTLFLIFALFGVIRYIVFLSKAKP